VPLPLVFHPDYVAPLPEGHRFPMPKFGKLYEVLVRDGVATLDQFHAPAPASLDEITLAHEAGYAASYLDGSIDPRLMRRIGFPWSPALARRTCTALGGSLLAARLALEFGLAGNLAGGTHHAFHGAGSGFCIFNDLGVVPRVLLREGRVTRVLIVDLDVHQGDGTAEIFAGDPQVFTFSIHCAQNFPFRKQQSHLDVEVAAGMEDDAYLALLADLLPGLLEEVRPDLVLYDAGVDPHRDDRLGKLALTDDGLYRRDRFVIETCLSRGVPTSLVIGGGYDTDHVRLARRHAIVFRAATDLWAEKRL
jgi:acetoin utilization deacetylase AcuC-like enzyme